MRRTHVSIIFETVSTRWDGSHLVHILTPHKNLKLYSFNPNIANMPTIIFWLSIFNLDTVESSDLTLFHSIHLKYSIPISGFIRPICLPPLDIDKEEFTNLPLAVAGWGRNGKYVSNIKQSTVVRLVPHDECQKSYPYLSKSHLCAAGRTGEDTCKGDSGGPLMMMFRGSYYVIGVVSGKRADSPCGTSVPSLYTNVFSYVPWIRDNIRN